MSEPTELELAAAKAHYHGPGCGDPGEYNGFLVGVAWQKSQSDEVKSILEHQADMHALWSIDPSAPEAILQAALRHLTAVLQGEPLMAKIAKDIYWNCKLGEGLNE